MDVMPTFMELGGVEEVTADADGNPVLPVRGRSFAPIIDDLTYEPHRGRYIALDEAGESILFHDDWKAVRPAFADEWELYSMSADPGEQHDVAAEHPELLDELVAEFEAHAEAVGILRRDREASD